MLIDQIATVIYETIFPVTHASYAVGDDPTEPAVTLTFEREYDMPGWKGPYQCSYQICFYADHVVFCSLMYYYTDRDFPDSLLQAVYALLGRSQRPRWVPKPI